VTQALAKVQETPGLDAYLDALEMRLERAVETHTGVVAAVGKESLAAGGKRMRPLLVFLSADADPPVAAGVAIELLHLATLLHDDVIDGAALRRGRASAWRLHGRRVAGASGDYLFARAFAELAATGDTAAVRVLADTALCLVRGEALQWQQRHDPDTTLESYLERCTLKTAQLFEAACVLGGGERLRLFGRYLGIAFQIADDILDCAGDTLETGKLAGTDLREGTPTLPLLLAAREDEVVRAALAGGPVDGVLLRVPATGALERSRAMALAYARRAREQLDGGMRRAELESLTDAVVNRTR
jgi:geranylgeranyl pyrophosphate synthase